MKAAHIGVLLLAFGVVGWPSPVLAGPIEDAKAMVDEGQGLLQKARRTRAARRQKLLADGLKKYARAYLLITGRNLQNDAPDLLQQINDQIAATNAEPEVAELRRELLAKAIDAAVAGELTEAYDQLATLRELDPREWTVEYALGVIGQRMEGG